MASVNSSSLSAADIPAADAANHTMPKASNRASRTIVWADRTETVRQLANMQEWMQAQHGIIYVVNKGMRSNRGLVGVFQDDEEQAERVLYNLQIQRGNVQSKKVSVKYPDPKSVIIPAGTTLVKVVQEYPLHVNGDGLRLFMSDSWDPVRIWDLSPEPWKARIVSRNGRPWNSIQKQMQRETELMAFEDMGVKRVVPKKRRAFKITKP